MKFYPYKKGGRTSFSHAEGEEDTKRFKVVLTWELEGILRRGGGVISFYPLKEKGGGGWA